MATIAAALAILSMAQYPGGTPLDARTVGYAPAQNFLSDLGMTVAYNGQANALGAALFVASMLVMVVGCSAVLGQWVRLYAEMPESRGLARAAFATTVLAAAAFVGVAVTPENRAMPLHEAFTLLAFRAAPVAVALLAAASLRARCLPRAASNAWIALTIVLAGYLVLLAVGPSTDTGAGLRVMVLAQKLVTAMAGGLMLLLCAFAVRHAGRA